MTAPRIVFFDLDHTLLPETSAEALFLQWMMVHGKISLTDVARTVRFLFQNVYDWKGTAIRRNKMYCAGRSRDELEDFADQVHRTLVEPRLSAEARKEITMLRAQGTRVVLLSGSQEFLVRRVATTVGADDVIATRLAFSNNLATGHIEGIHPYGKRKVSVILHYLHAHKIAASQCCAYANATSDIPHLMAVGFPVAVNPSPTLRQIAQQEAWPIRKFRR